MPPPDSQLVSPESELPPGARWAPIRGDETAALLQRLPLDLESKDRLVQEASSILGRCIPPTEAADSTTGLVLGYVQSGKTLSFTTVAALARDNGFPVVIVITGTKRNLNDQSRQRLEDDLGLDASRRWRLFKNPKDDHIQTIRAVLGDWAPGSTTPLRRRQSVLITVLKHFTHLRNLIGLLSGLAPDLAQTPVLIVDDEADHAGLNNLARRNRQSTTYQRLVALRRLVPHHTYLQYTATPQAPLLISIQDALSPQFAEVLTPGDDYSGGRSFFVENQSLVREIPAAEIPGPNNLLDRPPASLLSALRFFFLGVSLGYLRDEDERQNRSMLVHPSRETPGHAQFHRWISQIRNEWLHVLGPAAEEVERLRFIETFRPEYDDLARSLTGLPTLEELAGELAFAIQRTEEPIEVNAQPQTPSIAWRVKYPWILVGGEAMDRGFTVEGLTVTYMPRGMGVGNADTIQQRARFFGYKRPYLGLCRIFLERSVRDAFTSYVSHEEDLRTRLRGHRDLGTPLAEWRRAFFLDDNQTPTRRQLLREDFLHDTFADQWCWPKYPHGPDELIEANRQTVAAFVGSFEWQVDDGDARRTPEQRHLVAHNLPLRILYSELLLPLRLTDEYDSQRFTGVRLQVADALERDGAMACTVYRMSPEHERARTVDPDTDEIPTLFQGANYADANHTDQTYPGDERIRHGEGLTVQIHRLLVRATRTGPTIAASVPTIAVWVPASMSRDWVVQRRP